MKNNLIEELTAYTVRNHKETFPFVLERLRKEKGIQKASALYKKAEVDRRYYSKIMGESNPNISKNIAIAFGMALHLNKSEMGELLESAGFALSRSSGFDLAVLFCIEHQLYDIYEVRNLAVALNKALKISVQEKDIYAGKAEVDTADLTETESTGETERKTISEEFGGDLVSMFNAIADNLDDFAERLGQTEPEDFSEEDLSEEEAQSYLEAERITAPMVNVLNSIADVLNKAALAIADLPVDEGVFKQKAL